MEKLSRIIKDGIQIGEYDDCVKRKYIWMRDEFNKIIEKIELEEWVMNLKKSGNVELADGYASLQRIE